MTSDGGLILVRELDERRGFSELTDQHLTDSRGKNTPLPLADLLGQSVSEEWVGKASVLAFGIFPRPPKRLWTRNRAGALPTEVVRCTLISWPGSQNGIPA